jgi:hypothetical protein
MKSLLYIQKNLPTFFYTFFLKILFPAMLLFFLSCGSSGGGDGGGGGGGGGNTAEYYGTAAVTIFYESYDFMGNLEYSYQKTHTKNVTVQKNPPEKAGSIVENNPFNLVIFTNDTGSKKDGDFYFVSSYQGNVDFERTPVLMEYWTLAYQNGTINGTLTNTHWAESLAYNDLWAWDRIVATSEGIFPFIMDKNSTLTGTLSESTIHLIIQGNASSSDNLTDHVRPFSIEVSANR